jgi:ribonuclease HI
MEYILYTDGSSRGNPGRGGWGSIVIERHGETNAIVIEMGGREESVTNNRMEIISVIEGVKFILNKNKDPKIRIVSDSEYVVKAVNVWIKGWKKNNWRTSDKKPVKNQEIFSELDTLLAKTNFTIEHIRAHNGHFYNERVDVIATTFADDMPTDLFHGDIKDYKKFVESL